MFGTVLVCLQEQIIEQIGKENWKKILVEAGLPEDKVYRSVRFYPDTEFEHLVEITSLNREIPKDVLMRDLGKGFGQHLLSIYSIMFFPSWRTLEVIEKAAPKVFKSIQIVDPETPASYVKCNRVSPDEVIVHYYSPRKMCSYIMGIIDAMAERYNEKVDVTQVRCMRNDAPECEIHVKLLK